MILETSARNAACDSIVDLIDVGGFGDLVFTTAADAELAVLTWTAGTAFGTSTLGVATMNNIPDGTAVAGTCAKGKFRDGVDAAVLEGTVTLTGNGGDFILSKLTFDAGDTVTMTPAGTTLTVSAS